MKKLLLNLLCLGVAYNVNAQCATSSAPTNNCTYGDQINAFELNGVASVGNGGCGASGYNTFATPVRTLTAGNTYTWSAAVGSGTYNEGVGIWIDYNNDGFFDATDFLASSASAMNHNGSITIPSNAIGGTVKMRVRCAYNSNVTGGEACTNSIGFGYGETEDYNVVIVPQGAALNFDGVNDQVNSGTAISTALVGLNKLSVEAWVKPTTTAGPYRIIVGNYSNPLNEMQFCIRQQNTGYAFFIGTGSTGAYNIVSAVNTVTTGVWQHVAGTWDGNVAKIYINGVLSNTLSVTYPSFGATSNSVVIGANAVPELWSGDIDEVRIWSRALCQSEIQNNMTAEIATTGTNLLANYHFNQGIAAGTNPTVTTLTDASGNANTGTLTNFTLTGTTSNWVTPGGVTSGSVVTAFVSPIVSISGGSSICLGSSTTLTASGNVSTYTWTAGPTTAANVVAPTANTTYSVVGTNSLGCLSNMAVQTVTVNALPTLSVNVSNVLCNGGATGSATVTATGGASPYTYLASNGATTAAISNLMIGTYNYTVTDANSCVKSQSLAIVEPSAITTTISATNALCNGGATGSATVIATGGTAGYTYLWSNAANTSVVSNANAGVYTSTVTDANGCEAVQSATITQPSALNVTSVANNATICAGSSSTLTANGTGGTGVITYTWVAGATSNVNTVSPTTTSIYTVDATDANNCAGTSTVEVTVNALPIVMATTNNTLLCTGETATLTVSGATTYTWSTTENTMTIAVTPTVQTTYTVMGTDANGCENTTTIMQDVSLCTGVASLSNVDSAIKLYPNPNTGLFVIELTSTTKVEVTNSLGQIVISETFDAGKHNLDIHNEVTGVYFVKVTENNKQQIIKVIKQ